MRTLPTQLEPESKHSPYNDKTLSETPEFLAGQAILKSVSEDQLPNDYKTVLNSPAGCYMLGHKPPLITFEQAAKLHRSTYLEAVVSVHGIKALEEKILTMEQILSVPILYTLQALLTKHGVIALEKELITVDQAKKINCRSVQSILTQDGLIALSEGLITVKQLIENDKWGALHINYLTTIEGIKALRAGSMTYDIAQSMPDDELKKTLGIGEGKLSYGNIPIFSTKLSSRTQKSDTVSSTSSSSSTSTYKLG